MTGLETAVLIAAGGVLYAAVRHGERGPAIKATRRGGRAGRIPRKSRLVTLYNNTGARPVDADDAGTAAAELAGRVLGSTGRRSSRGWKAVKTACKRAGKRTAARSGDRWARRQAARPEQTFADKWRTLRANRPHREAQLRRRIRASLRRLGERLRFVKPAPRRVPIWVDVPTDPVPDSDPPKDPLPRRRPFHDQPGTHPGEPKMTVPTSPNPPADQLALPTDWAALVARVPDFEPESDVALVEWMKAEAAGVVAYAEAMQAARENCVNTVGLDPASLQGITIYAEHMSDASARMSEALAMFFAVYQEVLQAAANGVVMPHNGRWMTGGTVS